MEWSKRVDVGPGRCYWSGGGEKCVSIFHQFYYPHDVNFIGDFATLMLYFVNFMRRFVFIRWDYAKLPFNFEVLHVINIHRIATKIALTNQIFQSSMAIAIDDLCAVFHCLYVMACEIDEK